MTKTSQERRAAIYARIPFPHNVSAQEALDLQVSLCQERAKAQGYTIDNQHIYREMGGVLREPGEREQFAALVRAAQGHAFDTVLVYSLRFLSSKEDHVKRAIQTLQQHGIRVEALRDE